jgi:glucuronate isomerase
MPNVPTLKLHPHRLFSSDSTVQTIAAELYDRIAGLPIISPHGHTDPSWFSNNDNFGNATELLIKPDHYVFRMLFSQGITLEQLGIAQHGERAVPGEADSVDPEVVWQIFADHYYLFCGTPSGYWLDATFANVFGFSEKLCSENAQEYYQEIGRQVSSVSFKPRALLDRFNIELIATTEGALDPLEHHQALEGSDYAKRVITTFRPDDVVDASRADFNDNLIKLAQITGENLDSWQGYLAALRQRRAFFKAKGRATATDHGHPTALTCALSTSACETLYLKCRSGEATVQEQELFRGQLLTELAGMSVADGLVMQIHPGAYRNHNKAVLDKFGFDKGADVPMATEYVQALKPMLDQYGNNPKLNIILFTLDETTYSRELAPLAGHYPSVKLGPAWWFHDSPAGMYRYRQQVTETAGFYNTVGFNDDTRAFLSIPARHDVARRVDCRYLAELVANHQLTMDDAHTLAYELTYGLVKKAYQLDN